MSLRWLIAAVASLWVGCAAGAPTPPSQTPTRVTAKPPRHRPARSARSAPPATDETEPAPTPDSEPAEPDEEGSNEPTPTTTLQVETGFATWYGDDWHGKATASGERFNKHKLTAAHRTLPLGTRVRVTNTRNGRWVELRINDRGPYGKRRERIIDVAEVAAKRLDFIVAGVCPVRVEVLWQPPRKIKSPKKKKARHGA
ncbi:MAG: septal ring lytic transglycosylase RlpA family protein [Kofleriaceae bacterium]|nr:septal ring lytic transglycosylase RlpA family protein [Kofleriaceae bacterium]